MPMGTNLATLFISLIWPDEQQIMQYESQGFLTEFLPD